MIFDKYDGYFHIIAGISDDTLVLCDIGTIGWYVKNGVSMHSTDGILGHWHLYENE